MSHTPNQKIIALEQRIRELESQLSKCQNSEEQKLMDSLFEKVKILSVTNQNLTAVILQKKLLIDLPRAKSLLNRLRDSTM